MKLLDKITYMLLYLLGFAIIGLASLIDPNIGFKPLSWAIILDNILTYLAIICIIVATLLTVIDKFKTSDDEYLSAEKTIKDFASSPEYVPSIFSRFTAYMNYNRKKKQHEYNIKRELTILEAKSTDKDFAIWNFGTEEERKENKYCCKRALLEYKLSEEWEKQNLNLLSIKYDKVTAAIILSGVYSSKEANSPNDYVTKHKSGKVAREKLPQLLISFATTLITSSLAISLVFNSSVILNLVTKSAVLCWHTFMTIRYANTWKVAVTLKDIRWRRGILTEYHKWLEEEAARVEALNKETSEHIQDTLRKDEKVNAHENNFQPLSEGLEKEEKHEYIDKPRPIETNTE